MLQDQSVFGEQLGAGVMRGCVCVCDTAVMKGHRFTQGTRREPPSSPQVAGMASLVKGLTRAWAWLEESNGGGYREGGQGVR